MALTTDRSELEDLRASLPASAEADVPQLLSLAEGARSDQRYEEAERLLQAALLLDPEHGPTWALIGSVEDDLGDVETAKEAYRRAISISEDNHSTLALAQLLASVAEWSEARSLASYLVRESESESIREGAQALLVRVEKRAGGAE